MHLFLRGSGVLDAFVVQNIKFVYHFAHCLYLTLVLSKDFVLILWNKTALARETFNDFPISMEQILMLPRTAEVATRPSTASHVHKVT